MYCQNCGSPGAEGATQCAVCGGALVPQPLVQASLVREPDATGGLIPYKNPKALLSYYLGLFSLLPLVGLVLGITAVILGTKGLKVAKEFPEVRGQVHAWIGIVMGTVGTLLWALLLGMVVIIELFSM